MPVWLQTIIVLLIVGVALGKVSFELVRSLFGHRSRLGACCSHGCSTKKKDPNVQRQVNTAFVPVELLIRTK